MFVLVLAAEADETRQAITVLILCLVGIAVLLSGLTAWYWWYTSPKRRADGLLSDLGHFEAEGSAVLISVTGDDRHEPALFEPPPPLAVCASAVPAPTPQDRRDEAEAESKRIDVAARATFPTPQPAAPAPSTVHDPLPVTAKRAQLDESIGTESSTIACPVSSDRAVPGCSSDASRPLHGDEDLIRARRRQGQPEEAALSDDLWASAMKSAFDRLQH